MLPSVGGALVPAAPSRPPARASPRCTALLQPGRANIYHLQAEGHHFRPPGPCFHSERGFVHRSASSGGLERTPAEHADQDRSFFWRYGCGAPHYVASSGISKGRRKRGRARPGDVNGGEGHRGRITERRWREGRCGRWVGLLESRDGGVGKWRWGRWKSADRGAKTEYRVCSVLLARRWTRVRATYVVSYVYVRPKVQPHRRFSDGVWADARRLKVGGTCFTT